MTALDSGLQGYSEAQISIALYILVYYSKLNLPIKFKSTNMSLSTFYVLSPKGPQTRL